MTTVLATLEKEGFKRFTRRLSVKYKVMTGRMNVSLTLFFSFVV